MAIEIKNYSKKFGSEVIFNALSLNIASGNITAVLGGSGVGKTTLLNSVAGLESFSGSIKIDERNKSYVFQNSALVGGLTVFENLALVLPKSIKDKNKRKNIVMSALKDVELEKYANAYPSSLSAGMAQRVSIARAFIVNADLILMDEPFRGLDVGVKSRLIKNFAELWQKQHQTVLFVTHSIEEAVLLADRIIIFGGRPVNIVAEFGLSVPQAQRDMQNEQVAKVYAECFSVLTK